MTESKYVGQTLNTMLDIRNYLEKDAAPLKDGEFAEFWKSLTPEEREEFKNTPLPRK